MKNLLLIVLMSVAFASCDLFKKPEEEAPAKTPGVCLGAEEAVAQGFKACAILLCGQIKLAKAADNGKLKAISPP